ncbi:MAG: hypothetical protein QXL02_02835 [Candidatus Anstonellales archaeon]
MEYFKLISKEIRDKKIDLVLESYDTAILELIIDRLNRRDNVGATYIEIHPLIHQYQISITGLDESGFKNILEEIERELEVKF